MTLTSSGSGTPFEVVRAGDAGLVVHSDERGIAERTGGHAPQERVNRRCFEEYRQDLTH